MKRCFVPIYWRCPFVLARCKTSQCLPCGWKGERKTKWSLKCCLSLYTVILIIATSIRSIKRKKPLAYKRIRVDCNFLMHIIKYVSISYILFDRSMLLTKSRSSYVWSLLEKKVVYIKDRKWIRPLFSRIMTYSLFEENKRGWPETKYDLISLLLVNYNEPSLRIFVTRLGISHAR